MLSSILFEYPLSMVYVYDGVCECVGGGGRTVGGENPMYMGSQSGLPTSGFKHMVIVIYSDEGEPIQNMKCIK